MERITNRRKVLKTLGVSSVAGVAGLSATRPVSAYSFDDDKTDSNSSYEYTGDQLHHASNLEWDASYENGGYIHRFRMTGVLAFTDNDGNTGDSINLVEFVTSADNYEMIHDGFAPKTKQTDVSFSPNTASIYKAKEEAESIADGFSADYDMYKNDMYYSYGEEDQSWAYGYGNYQGEVCYQLRFNIDASYSADYAIQVEGYSENRYIQSVVNNWSIDANGTDLDVTFQS